MMLKLHYLQLCAFNPNLLYHIIFKLNKLYIIDILFFSLAQIKLSVFVYYDKPMYFDEETI